jgi:hypothetical protein
MLTQITTMINQEKLMVKNQTNETNPGNSSFKL